MLSNISARADERSEKRADKQAAKLQKQAVQKNVKRDRKTERVDSRQSSFLDARIDDSSQSDTVELSQQAQQSNDASKATDQVVVDSQAKLAAIREHLEKNRARLQ